MKAEEHLHRSVCNYLYLKYPEVMFNSDLSGIKLTKGQARKCTELRSTRGYPDLVIYEKKPTDMGLGILYLGLFIELKAFGTRVTLKNGRFTANKHINEQAEVMGELNRRGYLAAFAVGLDEAIELIDWYLFPWYSKKCVNGWPSALRHMRAWADEQHDKKE